MSPLTRRAALTVLTTALAVAVAGAVPATAAPAKDRPCPEKPRTEQERKRCGGAGSGGGAAGKPWAAKWRFARVAVDGTTTVRYANTMHSYTVDGTVSYRASRPSGTLDLRGKGIGGLRLYSGTAKRVKVTSQSRSTYVVHEETHDCSWTPPAEQLPSGLNALASVSGSRLRIQWSLTTSPTRCPVSMLPTMGTMLPSKALTTEHKLSALRGRRVKLPIGLDTTVTEPDGTLRAAWTGSVTLERG